MDSIVISNEYINSWIDVLVTDPRRSWDYLTTFTVILKDPCLVSGRSVLLRSLGLRVSGNNSILLLLEHSLIQLVQVDKKLIPSDPPEYMWEDGISTTVYVRKLLEFLCAWLPYSKEATAAFFDTDIIARSIIKFCLPQTTCCHVTAEYFARLLVLYLDGNEQWFKDVSSTERTKHVGDSFGYVCLYHGERQTLLDLFLDTVQKLDCDKHHNIMVNDVFKPYVLKAWNELDELVKCMKYCKTKNRLEQYVSEATRISSGFNYQLHARAMKIVLSAVVEEDNREQTEIPAMREAILRNILVRNEPNRCRHEAIIDSILDGERKGKQVLSPLEKLQGPAIMHRLVPLKSWELPSDHIVKSFLRMYYPTLAPRGTCHRRRIANYNLDSDLESEASNESEFGRGHQEGQALSGDDTMSCDTDDTEENVEADKALFEQYFYRQELDRIFEEVLPMVWGSFSALQEELALEDSSCGCSLEGLEHAFSPSNIDFD